ncbi:MAG: hypothetical protein ACW96M_08115 [Candidatus Thorarchaeota archaeon]|jgi:hypothetical protein
MSETESIAPQETPSRSLIEKLQIQSSNAILWTLLVAFFGAIIYLVFEMIPMPYLAISLFTLGLAPALSAITAVGAIRGPIAGLLTGYIGSLLTDIVLNGEIVALTLYGLALGVMGFVVGLANYDFTKGRSLAKLSVLSAVGLIFATLLTILIGLFVEQVAIIVAIGFQLLPLLTIGLPTVILLTPLLVRLWSVVSVRSPWP